MLLCYITVLNSATYEPIQRSISKFPYWMHLCIRIKSALARSGTLGQKYPEILSNRAQHLPPRGVLLSRGQDVVICKTGRKATRVRNPEKYPKRHFVRRTPQKALPLHQQPSLTGLLPISPRYTLKTAHHLLAKLAESCVLKLMLLKSFKRHSSSSSLLPLNSTQLIVRSHTSAPQ